eukprot:scaffold10643_cov151-Amphora_coffeaeformis.AAC.4
MRARWILVTARRFSSSSCLTCPIRVKLTARDWRPEQSDIDAVWSFYFLATKLSRQQSVFTVPAGFMV